MNWVGLVYVMTSEDPYHDIDGEVHCYRILGIKVVEVACCRLLLPGCDNRTVNRHIDSREEFCQGSRFVFGTLPVDFFVVLPVVRIGFSDIACDIYTYSQTCVQRQLSGP